jgi:hypothetical protein
MTGAIPRGEPSAPTLRSHASRSRLSNAGRLGHLPVGNRVFDAEAGSTPPVKSAGTIYDYEYADSVFDRHF